MIWTPFLELSNALLLNLHLRTFLAHRPTCCWHN